MFPFLSLSPFWASPFFPFLFLCLSLSLSLVICFLPSFLFSFLFLVLALFFVCFLVQDVILFVLFCLLSCLVLNHLVWFLFALYLVFLLLLFLFLLLSYFVIFWIWATDQKHLWKIWKLQKTQKWKMQKKRTFWEEQSAQVCSQIVFFFLFCVSLNLHFCWKHYKNRGFNPPKKTKTQKKETKNLVLETGPS